MVPHPGFQWRYPCEDLIPLVHNAIIIHIGRMVDRSGIIDDTVERVGIIIKGMAIIIKGMAIIIKGIVAIERVAAFPDARLGHLPFSLLFGKL